MLRNNFTLSEEKSEDNHSFPNYQSENTPAAHEEGKGSLCCEPGKTTDLNKLLDHWVFANSFPPLKLCRAN